MTNDIEEIIKNAEDKKSRARLVEAMLKSPGWEIFEDILDKKFQKIKDKNDYETIEDFRADRKAVEIVSGIVKELKDIVLEAEEADKILDKLSKGHKP